MKANDEFAKDLKRSAKDIQSVKSLGEAIGMPDEWDKDNITALIRNFKKAKFNIEGYMVTGATFMKMVVDEARIAHQTDNLSNPYNIKVKDSEARAVTAIPPPLHELIQQSYPTIFREKKHFDWFVKNFPEVRIARKVR